MYISEGIEDFIESLEVEGGRSKKTAENYQLYLERLVEFSGDIPVKEITSELLLTPCLSTSLEVTNFKLDQQVKKSLHVSNC